MNSCFGPDDRRVLDVWSALFRYSGVAYGVA
jgi:hypothetical protein